MSEQNLRITKAISILLMLALLASPQVFGSSISEYEVKAAFVYNFVKFVEFPSRAFTNGDSPMVIGVIGNNSFGDKIEQFAKGKTVNGRSLVVKRFGRVQDIATTCHVLFISSSEIGNLSRIMDRLKGSSVLTVGETDGFTRRGGIIGFVVDNDKIGFEVNLGAARRANLKISSKLLQLAKAINN